MNRTEKQITKQILNVTALGTLKAFKTLYHYKKPFVETDSSIFMKMNMTMALLFFETRYIYLRRKMIKDVKSRFLKNSVSLCLI